jgi:hypothetical protein
MDMVPREIQLPKDPLVNGQAMEAFLYKDATECPICFLYYPPYLNKTRCCDQPICSECFVQIKRPDPHPPEHESNDPAIPGSSPPETSAEAEALVSEPACCPYCQLPEFGVTYEGPPFRRGLSYASPPQGLDTSNSAIPPPSPSSTTGTSATLTPHTHKRRTTSISATASTVITTDRIRPDWATKLANARSHMARRSAAATALHTAAYLMGNGNADSRSFPFGSRGRFGRSRSDNSPIPSGSATPSQEQGTRSVAEQIAQLRRDTQEPGGSRRRGRIDDLEEMMMLEAIKLSLEAEEERKKKVEKEAAKDARKRAKEDKKKEKKERKGVYGSGPSSAGGSTLSLSLSGFGRIRGNSGGSNLAREVTPESVEDSKSKGKEADRSMLGASTSLAPIDFTQSENSTVQNAIPTSQLDDGGSFPNLQEPHEPPAAVATPDRPSHLRQMSNASSLTSSFNESAPNSLPNDSHIHGSSSSTPDASGSNVPGIGSNPQEVSERTNDAISGPMFSLRSLAAIISIRGEDKADTGIQAEQQSREGGNSSTEVSMENSDSGLGGSVATLTGDDSSARRDFTVGNEVPEQVTLWQRQTSAPELMITPVTPAATSEAGEYGKQLGAEMSGDAEGVITQ